MLNFVRILCCLLLGVSLSYGQAFDCAGDFYLVLSNAGGESQLYRVEIDPVTEVVVFDPVSANSTGANLNAIGYRRTDNLIYALDPSSYELYRIDASGVATPLATLFELAGNGDGYFAADITPDGKFLVLLGANDENGDFGSREIVYVDLESPNYTITRRPLIYNNLIFCTDIAFDPLSNVLFGFDLTANRLITIDPTTGEVDTDAYPISTQADAMGAIFFDSFGRLYGYGNDIGANESRRLFRVDTQTGAVTPLAEGPAATGKDGCACPFTVRLEKTVNPEVAFPCTEVVYAFQLANASGETQLGIELFDEMPADLTIVEVLRNPYGGNVVSGPGSNVLLIENMEVPPGLDSVTVRVRIDEFANGLYANQATLSGLPVSLGEETISDNPQTLQSFDSTLLLVQPLFVDLQNDTLPLCIGEVIELNATTHGVEYLWSDGSTDSVLTVTDPGLYWVQVTSPCEISTDSIFLFSLDPEVDLGLDLEIVQGDSVRLIPTLNPPQGLSLTWTDPLGNSLSCLDCEQPLALPLEDVTYTLTASGGEDCSASDDISVRIIKLRGIYAPNIFSPNGDGNNDLFFIQGQRNFDLPFFRIFNRWGALVYEARDLQLNDPRRGWDGTFRDRPLNPDVFVWYAQVRYPDGTIEVISGDVTLYK